MTETTQDGDLLRTRVVECDMTVVTALGLDRPNDPEVRHWARWTTIFMGASADWVYLRFWRGDTTPGGVAEAHAWVVDQVRRGVLPDLEGKLLRDEPGEAGASP